MAAASFASEKGLLECYTYNPTALVAVPTLLSQTNVPRVAKRAVATPSASSNATPRIIPTFTPGMIPAYRPGERVSFGIIVIMPFTALLVLVAIATALIVVKQHRYNKMEKVVHEDTVSASDTPYLQRKGELEARQCRSELESKHRPHEFPEDNGVFKLAIPVQARIPLVYHSEMQGDDHCKELEGEEHSKELE